MLNNHFICAKQQGGTSGTTARPTLMPGGCPDGYMPFENKCFKFVDDSVDWATAQGRCYQENKPYSLASLHDVYDQCNYVLIGLCLTAIANLNICNNHSICIVV